MTLRAHKRMVKSGGGRGYGRGKGYILVDPGPMSAGAGRGGRRFAENESGVGHAQMYRRLLESIAHYAKLSLQRMESGAGDLPQWTNDVLSKARAHLGDVTHFLRGQANHGIRYGAEAHGRAYMATKNLREILEYANESLSHLQEGAGSFPAWVENKISVSAEYMDLIGHWLNNEAAEGRQYGSYLNPVPGDAGDAALYRGRADGIGGKRRNPYSPNDFRHKIYDQGFQEGYGSSEGRQYGVPGIPAGQPGWAGNAGVAQLPHPSRGMAREPERTFGPGLNAGQGGVQTFPGGGGLMAVQTYGSLGYGSMGDGSMDMAVRGARSRSFSSTRSAPKKKRRNRR